MGQTTATIVAVTFAMLSLIHFYWALGGNAGKIAALPEVSGRPAFMPSTVSTVVVAVGLALCAILVAATAGVVGAPLPNVWLKWLCFALAFALFARAAGDFRLVGFFKRIHGTRFARRDTVLYAPLCLLLAVGVFYVAHTDGA